MVSIVLVLLFITTSIERDKVHITLESLHGCLAHIVCLADKLQFATLSMALGASLLGSTTLTYEL